MFFYVLDDDTHHKDRLLLIINGLIVSPLGEIDRRGLVGGVDGEPIVVLIHYQIVGVVDVDAEMEIRLIVGDRHHLVRGAVDDDRWATAIVGGEEGDGEGEEGGRRHHSVGWNEEDGGEAQKPAERKKPLSIFSNRGGLEKIETGSIVGSGVEPLFLGSKPSVLADRRTHL